jgi:acetyltransferase-like isoleucine patch superfamily enzyme
LSGDLSQAPVVGEGVRVGNAALLAGVTAWRTVIGTNAVVTNPVPTYEIWGGNPARKIGERR